MIDVWYFSNGNAPECIPYDILDKSIFLSYTPWYSANIDQELIRHNNILHMQSPNHCFEQYWLRYITAGGVKVGSFVQLQWSLGGPARA